MKLVTTAAQQSYFRRKFHKEKKTLESNLNMLDLTSKLEDRELERMKKIKKESGAKPEFQIGEDEKVES